jgi:hypothetical protein
MRMYGCVRLSLLPREELLNGGSGGRPRPITQRSGPHRLRRIQGMSHDREPKNLSDVARGCGAVRGHFDLHWMGHFYDVREVFRTVPAVTLPMGAMARTEA